MSKELLWMAYFELSNHMWDDENTPARYWYCPPQYKPENENDMEVWHESIRFMKERQYNSVQIDVGDAVRFDSHPEIAAVNAWSKNQLCDLLDEFREAGITPFPQLNFSCCHHTWMKKYRRMVSSDEYYRFAADVIAETNELFGHPSCFMLGLDEENAANQRWREMVTIRQGDLYWHDLYYLFDVCEKNGTRPWVFGDIYWDRPAEFEKRMPKSVLISNWIYQKFMDYAPESYEGRAIAAYEKLEKLGYDQIPCSSTWNNNLNTEQTVAHGKTVIAPERLKGFCTAPWVETTKDNEFAIKNDLHRLYLARKKYYPETLK